MPFVPPFYADLGKSSKDLLTKKFDYANQMVIKRTSACGLKIETTVQSEKSLTGSVKLTYKQKGQEYEASQSTAGDLTGKVKFTDLSPGVVLTIDPTIANAQKLKTTVDYSQDNFSASAVLDVTAVPAFEKDVTVEKDGKKEVVKEKVPLSFKSANSVSAVVGFDGISLGAKVAFDNAFVNPDMNMAFNYGEKDFQFTVATETRKDGPAIVGKFFQQVNSNLQSGFSFESPENKLTLASQLNLDSATIFKNTLSTDGIVNASIQHTLANPKVQVNLAGQFKTANFREFTSQKYGLGFTLGDL